ncbi:ESX secretion-associated protein EspG [Saccharomonospora piscinae]|uniref:ESX secretion-associated protein EspG n=1 Tax=Saccharomonospora piscinae TaxID=687388 RepID=UPI00046753C1|nr:ESX secretion-associated protein EspG [Saccharomonospora piscinae]
MIRVSASALDVLWSDLGLPGGPGPLDVRSVGQDDGERATIRAAVYDNLTERGLYRGGELDPALRERLDVLARAVVTVECEAVVDVDEPSPLCAVAAATRGRGVLAVQPRRTVALSAIRPGEVVSAAVGVLPGFAAGPGVGVSLPASALDSVRETADPDSPGRRARVAGQQAREVLAVQARPVLAAGQFSLRVRDGAALRRLGGVSWFVTDAGGYLGTVTDGRGGEPWWNLVPADPARIAERLTELHDDAVAARA